MQEIEPDLTQGHAHNFFNRTFFLKNKGKLKKKLIKAQRTMMNRSQVTVAQQFRWFKNFEEALSWLRKVNMGVCRKTGKQFG